MTSAEVHVEPVGLIQVGTAQEKLVEENTAACLQYTFLLEYETNEKQVFGCILQSFQE